MLFNHNSDDGVLINFNWKVIEKTMYDSCCWYYSLASLSLPEAKGLIRDYAEEQSEIELDYSAKILSEEDYLVRTKELSQRILSEQKITQTELLKLSLQTMKRKNQKITDESIAKCMHNLVISRLVSQTSLKTEDKWRPTDTDAAKTLLSLLKKFQSPIMVAGHLGFNYYTGQSEYKGLSFGGRRVYQFPPKSLCERSIEIPTHSVLILGMRQINKEYFIYYVDPTEHFYTRENFHRLNIMRANSFLERMYNIHADSFCLFGENRHSSQYTETPFLVYQPRYSALLNNLQPITFKKHADLTRKNEEKKPDSIVTNDPVYRTFMSFFNSADLAAYGLVDKHRAEICKPALLGRASSSCHG